jgi:hypothetical protein
MAALLFAVGALALRVALRPEPGGAQLVTTDGSVARLLESATAQRVLVDSRELVEIELAAGAAEYQVTKRAGRRYRVRAGDVTVEVLGTVFEVDRRAGGTRVMVREGRVHVSAPGGDVILSAGDDRVFSPPARSDAPAAEIVPPVAAAPAPPRAPRVESAAELLAIADRYRADGEPHAAARVLRRALVLHGDPANASLAAFTLGRVLLEELHAPVEAAAAFGRAQALHPRGALAEDAAAREVEAWGAAGERARARAGAARYLGDHPEGRRAAFVRRLGQLD